MSEKSNFLLWIDETPRPGYANMAIDTALLDRAEQQGESWLRLYQWEPHCLSFGRHEPATRRYDVHRIQDQGLNTVRRPTGGRAVWHANELTYAVAAPSSRFGSLQAAYQEIHAMLATALASFGLTPALAERSDTMALDAGACFSQPVGGEVTVSGQKVIGSAQLRRGAALLQHGSIMLEDDQSVLEELTAGSLAHHRVTPLKAILGRSVRCTELASSISRAAAARWSGIWERVSDSDPILRAASRHFSQFQSPAWTWKT
jgi:lipoate-protein ligase A